MELVTYTQVLYWLVNISVTLFECFQFILLLQYNLMGNIALFHCLYLTAHCLISYAEYQDCTQNI